VVNQGYLKKKSPKTFMGFAQWQERFFVLEKDKFLYYGQSRFGMDRVVCSRRSCRIENVMR
jgi:hypothetical protein